MTSAMLKETIENLWRAPAEIKNKLLRDLGAIEKYGVGKALDENPDFLGRLLTQLRRADGARVFNDISGAADQFVRVLWEGVSSRVEKAPALKILLEKAERDIHVNIEASDSPFRCYFIVERGKIRGGSGLLHFKDEDFRFMGPTETLLGLFLGDLHLGFSNLHLQTAGHSGWSSRVNPIMREIAKLLKRN
jgi:hypothetical protein